MTTQLHFSLVKASFLLALFATQASADAGHRIVLERPTMVVDSGQPTWVQYAVEELSGYLKKITGREIPEIGRAHV